MQKLDIKCYKVAAFMKIIWICRTTNIKSKLAASSNNSLDNRAQEQLFYIFIFYLRFDEEKADINLLFINSFF